MKEARRKHINQDFIYINYSKYKPVFRDTNWLPGSTDRDVRVEVITEGLQTCWAIKWEKNQCWADEYVHHH